MKRKWMVLGVSAVCVAGALMAAAPADSKLGAGMGEQGPLARLMTGQLGKMLTLRSELNITAEQREKIQAIVKSHKAEIAAVAQPIVEKRRALREAVSVKNPDEKAIRAASDELGKAIGNAAVLGSKVKAEVRAVLTPEQMQKIESFRKQHDQSVDQFLDELGKP